MILAPPLEIVDLVRPELREFFHALFRIPIDPGTLLTSWWRDPRVNRSVGGLTNSFHLWALAVDVVAPDPAHLIGHAREVGLDAIDEGSHVHLEPIGAPPSLPESFRV